APSPAVQVEAQGEADARLADAVAALAGLFNCMPVKNLEKDVAPKLQKQIGAALFAEGYRLVFDRWYMQEPKTPIASNPFLCIRPACGNECSQCNHAISGQESREAFEAAAAEGTIAGMKVV